MKIVCCEPDFDVATHWWYYWVRELVAKPARRAGYEVVELYAAQDNPSTFRAEMQDAIWLAGVGHGNADQFTGQNTMVLLDVANPADGTLMKGRFYAPCSCSTGKRLAPWLVEAGAVAAWGYADLFWFVVDRNNWPDGHCHYFAESHHAVDRAMLIEGKTVREAYEAAYDAFSKAMQEAPEQCRPYLMHDRDNLGWWGDPDATITEPPEPPPSDLRITAFYKFRDETEWTPIGEMEPAGFEYQLTWEVPREGICRLRYVAEEASERAEAETGDFTIKFPPSGITITPVYPQGGETIESREIRLRVKVEKD